MSSSIAQATRLQEIVSSDAILSKNKEIQSSLSAISNISNVVLSVACSPNPSYCTDFLIEYYDVISDILTKNIQKCLQTLSLSNSSVAEDYNDLFCETVFSSNSVLIPKKTFEKTIAKLKFSSSPKISDSANNMVSVSIFDFFTAIFIPLLICLLSTFHAQYLANSSSEELMKMHLENLSQQERLIELESEQLKIQEEISSYLRDISISLDNLPSCPESHEDDQQDIPSSEPALYSSEEVPL